MKTWLKRSLLGLAALISALVIITVVLEHRTYEAPHTGLQASADPAVIARGRYLAYGAAHCVQCHGAPEVADHAKRGEHIPLSGGREMKLPFGVLRPPNLTSDLETGIGALTDEQLARALRHGVRHDGQTMVPIMPFNDLSDEDLTAVISFLRTEPPVRHAVKTRELNPLGHAVLAFVIRPKGPSEPVRHATPKGATVENGKYLAHSVANCNGCHTPRDFRTGQEIGPTMSGGNAFPSETLKGVTYFTPNLTPDPKTGRIASWSEETFVARLKAGAGADGTHMPWPQFATMSDDDLRAVYRYLRSLPPVEHEVPAVQLPTPVAQR